MALAASENNRRQAMPRGGVGPRTGDLTWQGWPLSIQRQTHRPAASRGEFVPITALPATQNLHPSLAGGRPQRGPWSLWSKSMVHSGRSDTPLRALVQAIVAGDATAAIRILATSPELALKRAGESASHRAATDHFLDEIGHYFYVGDTALHIAAATYQRDIARDLIARGTDVRARNRRGAGPLHYAADGAPGSRAWNPRAQAATIACLLKAGADPNAVDKSGVTPLHRAVRARCAAAVKALLDGGSDALARNKNGSAPILLATQNTGRGGSGSPEAKAQQEEILQLLKAYGVT